MIHLLLLDHRSVVPVSVQERLQRDNIIVTALPDLTQARQHYEQQPPDVVLTDQEGFDYLRPVRSGPLIVFSSMSPIPLIQQGAFDVFSDVTDYLALYESITQAKQVYSQHS